MEHTLWFWLFCSNKRLTNTAIVIFRERNPFFVQHNLRENNDICIDSPSLCTVYQCCAPVMCSDLCHRIVTQSEIYYPPWEFMFTEWMHRNNMQRYLILYDTKCRSVGNMHRQKLSRSISTQYSLWLFWVSEERSPLANERNQIFNAFQPNFSADSLLHAQMNYVFPDISYEFAKHPYSTYILHLKSANLHANSHENINFFSASAFE